MVGTEVFDDGLIRFETMLEIPRGYGTSVKMGGWTGCDGRYRVKRGAISESNTPFDRKIMFVMAEESSEVMTRCEGV